MPRSNVPIFNAKAHSYTDPTDGFVYTSVTRWISKFKEPFDEVGTAERIAAREGIAVELILDEWKTIRDNSTEFGTAVHKLLEDYHEGKKITNHPLKPILENFKKLKITFNKNTFFEKLVFNRKLGIAGMSDIISHNSDGKTFDVYDFKTNKKLRYCSDFEDFLLEPLDQYPCCEYFSYALQLSMYAYLYKEMSGLEPRRLKIFWYQRQNPDNYKDLEGNWKIIDMPYLEEDIKKCLKYEKQTVLA